MHTDRLASVSVRSCVRLASAKYGCRQHVENLCERRPKDAEIRKKNSSDNLLAHQSKHYAKILVISAVEHLSSVLFADNKCTNNAHNKYNPRWSCISVLLLNLLFCLFV